MKTHHYVDVEMGSLYYDVGRWDLFRESSRRVIAGIYANRYHIGSWSNNGKAHFHNMVII